MAEAEGSKEFLNFFKQLRELDGKLSREENYKRLLDAERVWSKRQGPEARIREHMIRAAKPVFASEIAFEKYKRQLIEYELMPLIELALSDGAITKGEFARIVSKAEEAGIRADEVQKVLDARGISVKPAPKTERKPEPSGEPKPGDEPVLARIVEEIEARAEKVALGIAILPGLLVSSRFFTRLMGFPDWALVVLTLGGVALLAWRSCAFAGMIRAAVQGAIEGDRRMAVRLAVAAGVFIAVGAATAWAGSFTMVLFPTVTMIAGKMGVGDHLERYFAKEGVSNASRVVALGKALTPVLVLAAVMIIGGLSAPRR